MQNLIFLPAAVLSDGIYIKFLAAGNGASIQKRSGGWVFILPALAKCLRTAVWLAARGNKARKQRYHLVVIFRAMRKRAVRAVLYLFTVFFQIAGISRTVFFHIQRAVAKQAVKLTCPPVAGKVLAFSVLKKAMGIFHWNISSGFFL